GSRSGGGDDHRAHAALWEPGRSALAVFALSRARDCRLSAALGAVWPAGAAPRFLALAAGPGGRRTELHWETVTAPMRDILDAVRASDLCPRFYLAGGTALALQLGHQL